MNKDLKNYFIALIALLHEHIKCVGGDSELAVGINSYPNGIMNFVNRINKYCLTGLDAKLQLLITCLSKVKLPKESVSGLRSTRVSSHFQINSELEAFHCGSSQEIAEELYRLKKSLLEP